MSGVQTRFWQQFAALYRKNALVAWRNRRATLLRLLAPFFFLILALVIDKAIRADNQSDVSRKVERNPAADAINAIPSCTSDIYIGKQRKCYDFFYTPAGDPDVEKIVGAIRKNNGKRPIPVERVKGFPDVYASDSYMAANPETTLGAIHFRKSGASNISFVIQTNTTVKYFKNVFQDRNRFAQLPLQLAAHREIARHYLTQAGRTGDAERLQWLPALRLFAHPALSTGSVVGNVLGPFIFAACMFSFVIQLGLVVAEKENGLRQALTTMGMKDSSYWLSWAAWEVTIAFLSSHLICVFGLILQFRMFLKNAYGLLFLSFFLFQLAMSSVALLLSTLIPRATTATYVGFLVFILGWVLQSVVLSGIPFSPDYYKDAGGHVTRAFAALPWTLLAKGLQDLGKATEGGFPGIKWAQRQSYCKNLNSEADFSYDPTKRYYDLSCVYPLQQQFGIYIVLWIVYFLAALYLDNVLPDSQGVRRPFYYFLLPSYWFKGAATSRAALARVQNGAANASEAGLDEDVAAEQRSVKALLNSHLDGASTVPTGNAVEVFGLRKVFTSTAASTGCCGGCFTCACCRKGPAFEAIKNSWFTIRENTLFCLLGPNGAGKTTTINCLTGVLPPTAGEALVYGEPITNASGLDRIRSRMGVCPQFDVLWGELTGREHLEIYASVKGVAPRQVKAEAAALLDKVKLTSAGRQRAGSYSGGMKRRLSVAIALLGDPAVVYLDEPTTGMDPISRRYVWDIIEEAKQGRAIVLTTHSMEEADILGDRIAIMARGQLRCIGTSLRLKQKFGAGYQVAVSTAAVRGSATDLAAVARNAEAVRVMFKGALGVEPTEVSKAYTSWLVPRQQEAALVGLLAQLEARRVELGVSDIQLSLTSLEEVFLTIARQAEMEAALKAGNATSPWVLPDGRTLNIPIGEPTVEDPRDGTRYDIKWAQDDSGRLVVLNCKPLGAQQA